VTHGSGPPRDGPPGGLPGGPLRSLRTELLFNLAFLTSAAVILAGMTTLLVATLDPDAAVWALGILWAASTALFVLFGRHLVHRLVLRPLAELSNEADRLATGQLTGPPAGFETRELAHLSDRFQSMAEQLLDVQSQAVRAEKLAGVGRLAAGVAHEIRNPLGALGTYVEVLRQRGADASLVDGMRREVARMDRIVEGLLDYARPGTPSGNASLAAIARDVVGFLGDQGALKGHEVVLEVSDSTRPVRGDPKALEQVLVNLMLNARDASKPGGRIWVGAVPKTFVPRNVPEHRSADANGAGNHAHRPPALGTRRPWRPDLPAGTVGGLLYVADEGPGVPEAERERIFDPFYTTKDPGRGTGLGLAIVARTVHDAGGVVWVDRAREGGAVFKVFLPQAEAVDAHSGR
jgi:two-component system, NtrC family, sensor kinase